MPKAVEKNLKLLQTTCPCAHTSRFTPLFLLKKLIIIKRMNNNENAFGCIRQNLHFCT